MAKSKWKDSIHERDGRRCRICGSQNSLTVHHKLPVSRGGKSNEENCVTWCSLCHKWYHKVYGLTISDDYGKPVEQRFSYRGNKQNKKVRRRRRKTKRYHH